LPEEECRVLQDAPQIETQFLKAIPAFADIDTALLGRLVGDGIIDEVPADRVLFEQGTKPEFLFVLLRGMVALTSRKGESSTTVDILKPVSQFQLATVLLDAPYLLTAQTLQPSRLLRMRAGRVRRIIESEPSLAMAAARFMSTQYRNVVGEVLDLKLHSVTQRLAGYLLALLEDEPARTEIRLPFGKRHLASLLGASPEHLSRAFAALRAHGVTTRGARVTVADPAVLTSLSSLNGNGSGRGRAN
jgi:CRP/FNR family transcriptional regulator, transcriptional activator FtrB